MDNDNGMTYEQGASWLKERGWEVDDSDFVSPTSCVYMTHSIDNDGVNWWKATDMDERCCGYSRKGPDDALHKLRSKAEHMMDVLSWAVDDCKRATDVE